jgi:hypothetical protein
LCLHRVGLLRFGERAGVVPSAGAQQIQGRHVTSRSVYAERVVILGLGLMTVGAAFGGSAVGVTVQAVLPPPSVTTVTLTEPAERGDVLQVGDGRSARSYVVRAVLDDLTLHHVVAVGRWRRWHRWAWARRWL